MTNYKLVTNYDNERTTFSVWAFFRNLKDSTRFQWDFFAVVDERILKI